MNNSSYCERVLARLPRFLDHELPALEQALDRGHMESCASCARERDLLLRLIQDMRLAMAPNASELEREMAAVLPRLGALKLRPAAIRLLAKRSTLSLLTAAGAILILLAIDGDGGSLNSFGSGRLFESLGVANWHLPLGQEFWGVK